MYIDISATCLDLTEVWLLYTQHFGIMVSNENTKPKSAQIGVPSTGNPHEPTDQFPIVRQRNRYEGKWQEND